MQGRDLSAELFGSASAAPEGKDLSAELFGAKPQAAPAEAEKATPAVTSPMGGDDFSTIAAAGDEKNAPMPGSNVRFLPEFGKGVVRAVKSELPSMYETSGVLKDVGVISSVQNRLGLFDKIDKGEITNHDQLRQPGDVNNQGRMYLAASPEARQRMRERSFREIANRKDFIAESVRLLKEYQKEGKKYAPMVDKASKIESLPDFANWLGSTMGSNAVQLAPMILAAATTGGVGLVTLSTIMGVSEATGERLKFLDNTLKNMPPGQRMDATVNYLRETGDVTLAVGIASGLLDAALGPEAAAVKGMAKEMAKATTKKEAIALATKESLKKTPRQMGEEALTGGAQQAMQIAGSVRLGEKPEFATKENLIEILDAAAAEGASAGTSPAFTAARAALSRGPKKPEQQRTEPELGEEQTPPPAPPAPPPAAPKAPTRVEPTLGEVPTGSAESDVDGRVEPTLEPTPKPPAPVEVPAALAPAYTPHPDTEAQIEATMANLPFLSREEATAMVVERQKRQQAQMDQRASVMPPAFQQPVAGSPQEARLRDIFMDLLGKGMPPEQAYGEAQRLFAIEQAEDENSQADTQGAADVAGSVPGAGGAGASVAGVPGAGSTTGRAKRAKRSGVVPAEPNAGESSVGEGTESVAVTPATAEAAGPQNQAGVSRSVAGEATTPAEPAAPTELSDAELEAQEAKFAAEDAEQQQKVTQAKEVARANASVAFDTRGEYDSLDAAIDAHYANVQDTLREQGVTDPYLFAAAAKEYEAQVAKLREAEESKAAFDATTDTPAADTAAAEAPATETAAAEAPATQGKKRGRPKIERTPEEQQKVDEQKKQSKRDAANADYGLKKATALLDESTQPLNEDDFESDEALQQAKDEQRANKREAIKQLLTLEALPGIRGTAVHKRIKAALADKRITPQELADIKRGLEVAKKTLASKDNVLSLGTAGVYPVNPSLTTATTAAEAISAIVRTGNLFQRLVANRLRGLLNGVKFVVLEKGQPLPEELKPYAKDWNRAIGMFVPTLNAVYVRGASFGIHQGVNNVTALHELLHAATLRKIAYALVKISRDLPLPRKLEGAVMDLVRTMSAAGEAYERGLAQGRIDPELQRLVERTDGAIFEDPFEFVSYGQTEPALQGFLSNLRVPKSKETAFSRFVRGIMDLLGLEATKDSVDAMTSLVDATDRILSSRVPMKESRFLAEALGPAAAKKGNKPTGQPMDKKLAKQVGIRTQREVQKDVTNAIEGLRKSNNSEMFKRASILQKALNSPGVLELAKTYYKAADYKARQIFAKATSFDFLVRMAEKELPPIKDAFSTMQNMLGHINQIHDSGVSQIQMLDKDLRKDPPLEGKLNDILYVSTVSEVDPSDPNSLEKDSRLRNAYEGLGERGQRTFKRIIDFHEDLRNYLEMLLDKNIRALEGLSAETKENLLAQIYQKFQQERRIEPYLPLMRDGGQYWLAVGEGDDTAVYIYDSRVDRDNDAKRIAKEAGKTVEEMTSSESREMGMGNDIASLRKQINIQGTLLSALFNAVDASVPTGEAISKDAAEINQQLKDDFFDIWLTLMPEQGFRKQFIQRKARAGYRPDIRRNMAEHVARIAPALARLKYGTDLRRDMTRMDELVKEQEMLHPIKEAVQDRIKDVLAPQQRNWADRLAAIANKLTYLTYLVASSTALLQPLGVIISGVPIVAAQHKVSYLRAARIIMKNALAFKQYGTAKKLPDGSVVYEAPSLTRSRNLTADQKYAVKRMAESNVANQTYAGFLWDAAGEQGILPPESKLGKTWDFMVNALLRNTERLSREVLYISSYELGREAGLSQAEAADVAADHVRKALGEYDIHNKPVWMSNAVGRVAFAMKMYPVVVMQQLLGSFMNIIKPFSRTTRKQAMREFAGLWMTTAMIAGAYNMPFADMIIQMLVKMLDDDDEDEPDDLKKLEPVTWFKTVWMPEKLGQYSVFGKPLDQVIGEGPLSAFSGISIGSRVGMNDLWARDPKPGKNALETFNNMLQAYIGGPLLSYTQATLKGIEDFKEGDPMRGIERVVPFATARNFLTALRAKREGYDTPSGVFIEPEDVTAKDVAAQSIGFSPLRVNTTREASFKVAGGQQQIAIQRDLITRRLKSAIRRGDDDLLEKVIEEAAVFSARNPEHKLTPEQMVEIISDYLEKRNSNIAGIPINAKNARIAIDTADTLEERLQK